MKLLEITGTAVDLAAQSVPFLSNYTVVIFNLSSGQLVVQDSDVVGSGYGTLATIPANSAQEVTFDKQFVKLSTSATVYAVGN